MNAITIQGLAKSFGKKEIIKNISFTIEENKIFGLIGKNGAGKTTLIKCLLGLYPYEKGEVLFFDKPLKKIDSSLIGYLQDVPEFYKYMSGYEYLKLCAEICLIPKKQIKPRITQVLNMVGLEVSKQKIKGYSRGMKQRLGIASALLNKPKILILDEPTSALDPLGRKEVLDILDKLRNETTIVFSTHILSDVEKICENIVVIDNGNIVKEGNIQEFKKLHEFTSYELVLQDIDDFIKIQKEFPSSTINNFTVNIKEKVNQKYLLSFLLDSNISFSRFDVNEPSLEDLFLEAITR